MDFSSLITIMVNAVGWVVLAYAARTVWVLILDSDVMVLPWQGFRRVLGDWRGFVLVAATFAFSQTMSGGFNPASAWQGFSSGWIFGLLTAIAAAAAMILALESLKSLWEGGGGFGMIGDWLRNPVKRVPEFLATVTGSLILLWAGGALLSMIPALSTAKEGLSEGQMVPWPEMNATLWGPGILAMLFFGIPAVLAIFISQGENEAPLASLMNVLKRWWGIAQNWRMNLSWLVGGALLGWVWNGLRSWMESMATSGVMGDLMMFSIHVLGVAVVLGMAMSLFGLRDAHRAGSKGM
ncbi:hypothetical protein H8D30_00870 [bacterium]|nr:hypothetical protein [bacterium]